MTQNLLNPFFLFLQSVLCSFQPLTMTATSLCTVTTRHPTPFTQSLPPSLPALRAYHTEQCGDQLSLNLLTEKADSSRMLQCASLISVFCHSLFFLCRFFLFPLLLFFVPLVVFDKNQFVPFSFIHKTNATFTYSYSFLFVFEKSLIICFMFCVSWCQKCPSFFKVCLVEMFRMCRKFIFHHNLRDCCM